MVEVGDRYVQTYALRRGGSAQAGTRYDDIAWIGPAVPW